MKDLDQSDVNADAETMMSEEIERLGEDLEGADLMTIIMILESHDLLDSDAPLNSKMVQEMIACTQSNPQKAHAALERMIELDNAIADL